MSSPADDATVEDALAARIKAERELRKWSTARLASEITAAGCPMPQSAVWRIESGEPRRSISVNELVAMARVFGLGIDEFLGPWATPLVCRNCKGAPPSGFTCNTCGQIGGAL